MTIGFGRKAFAKLCRVGALADAGWTFAKAVVTDDRRTAVEVNAFDELPPRSFALLSLRKAAE